ncbi:hypothetical protein F4779DRAFT_623279 [Xylariaceae sp. FL0662B]|nr:hypothetical protein F4779DRAFT_623279 [Xylariaceae sp. FL0662B]
MSGDTARPESGMGFAKTSAVTSDRTKMFITEPWSGPKSARCIQREQRTPVQRVESSGDGAKTRQQRFTFLQWAFAILVKRYLSQLAQINIAANLALYGDPYTPTIQGLDASQWSPELLGQPGRRVIYGGPYTSTIQGVGRKLTKGRLYTRILQLLRRMSESLRERTEGAVYVVVDFMSIMYFRIAKNDMFDFLIDIVSDEEPSHAQRANPAQSQSAQGSVPQTAPTNQMPGSHGMSGAANHLGPNDYGMGGHAITRENSRDCIRRRLSHG